MGLAVAIAIQMAAGPVRAEGPLEAKLFVVAPSEVGDGWAAERERDDGDLYQVVYAGRAARGEPPMATVTIGLAGSEVDVGGLLAESRSLYEANGYRFEPSDDLG